MNRTLQKLKAWREANVAKGLNSKFWLFFVFLCQLAALLILLDLVLRYLSLGFSPSEKEFLTQIKELDSTVFMAIAMAFVGYLRFHGSYSVPMCVAALWSIVLAVSTQMVSLIPTDIEIPAPYEVGVGAIYSPIVGVFVSMIGVAMNLVFLVFQIADRPQNASSIQDHK